ncbi:MAG TPA: aminotransferase class IV [Gemmataceae bacterium]|nr:aminotransferase class IV [Gemmataceae bacterium]
MNGPLAYLNGKLLAQSQASIALNDAGFVFGATVTDLCRTIRHRLYRWPEHWVRFQQSCRSTYIDLAIGADQMRSAAEELVVHNAKLLDANDDLALVLFATPGPLGHYLGQPSNGLPTLGMHTFPLPFIRYRPWIANGVVLATPGVRAVPGDCVPTHIKQRSRMHWWLAQHEVPDGAQALLLDHLGNVTETASSNLLLVKDGTLMSPPLDTILNGVSLGVVAEFASKLGVPLRYRPISLEDCYAADEVLLTCTTYCIAGVRQINHQPVAWPGPMLPRFVEAWSAEVGVDIHRQVLGK